MPLHFSLNGRDFKKDILGSYCLDPMDWNNQRVNLKLDTICIPLRIFLYQINKLICRYPFLCLFTGRICSTYPKQIFSWPL